MTDNFVLFSGTANPNLGEADAAELGVRLGACAIERFPDGEFSVRLDESVRRREVFLVQPTAPPVNDRLVELLAFADACRRSAAARVTVVVPYFVSVAPLLAAAIRRILTDGSLGDRFQQASCSVPTAPAAL
jgi:ribose-phosphate pyrophosphokinase